MINHHPNLELLSAHVNGHLPASLAAAISMHNELCPQCTQTVKTMTEEQAEMAFEQSDIEHPSSEIDLSTIDIEQMIAAITNDDDIELLAEDVPMTISAITEDSIKREGLEGAADFARRVPGVTFNQGGKNQVSNFVVRGIATSANDEIINKPVSVYIDDIPITTSNGSVQPDPRLYDVERIEGGRCGPEHHPQHRETHRQRADYQSGFAPEAIAKNAHRQGANQRGHTACGEEPTDKHFVVTKTDQVEIEKQVKHALGNAINDGVKHIEARITREERQLASIFLQPLFQRKGATRQPAIIDSHILPYSPIFLCWKAVRDNTGYAELAPPSSSNNRGWRSYTPRYSSGSMAPI